MCFCVETEVVQRDVAPSGSTDAPYHMRRRSAVMVYVPLYVDTAPPKLRLPGSTQVAPRLGTRRAWRFPTCRAQFCGCLSVPLPGEWMTDSYLSLLLLSSHSCCCICFCFHCIRCQLPHWIRTWWNSRLAKLHTFSFVDACSSLIPPSYSCRVFLSSFSSCPFMFSFP